VILVIVFFMAVRLPQGSIDNRYLTAGGKVTETRIVIDHIQDSQYGGQIYYRIDAHVSYQIDGQVEDRWLTASETTTARELLSAKLATQPKTCQVYWFPNHPENARCRFQ
jgi:hypothetical protein